VGCAPAFVGLAVLGVGFEFEVVVDVEVEFVVGVAVADAGIGGSESGFVAGAGVLGVADVIPVELVEGSAAGLSAQPTSAIATRTGAHVIEDSFMVFSN
jgi:hypothetical protein